MADVLIPTKIFWLLFSFVILLIGAFLMLLYFYFNSFNKDLLIFFDKANRWTLKQMDLANKDEIEFEKKTYLILKDSMSLNRKGKALGIYSVNKPEPLRISHNSAEWLSSESMRNIINNELIKKLMSTTEGLKDTLMLLGSIGGIIAGIASAVMLLKSYGVIK